MAGKMAGEVVRGQITKVFVCHLTGLEINLLKGEMDLNHLWW